jgi:hypothetical protein
MSTSDRIEPLNAAERMRLHRKRHRNGLLCVRLLLHETEIDGARPQGALEARAPCDQSAVETAIGVFIMLLRVRVALRGEYVHSPKARTSSALISSSGHWPTLNALPTGRVTGLTGRPWSSCVRGRSAASLSRRPALADRCRSQRDCLPTKRVRLHGVPYSKIARQLASVWIVRVYACPPGTRPRCIFFCNFAVLFCPMT